MHSPDKIPRSPSSSSLENDAFDSTESTLPFADQQIYNEGSVAESDSWPSDLPNNVRCLVKKDENQTLKNRLSQFFFNEDIADVHFVVMDEDFKPKTVPAHKFILSAGSCVFKAMFYGPLADAGSEITITDIDYKAFFNVLKYLYTDEADINPLNLASTLYAAKKYQVTNLEKICVNFLSWSLTSENVLLVLSQAILFDEAQLIERCWTKIEEDIKEIIEASSFENTDHETILKLIEHNCLALKEIDLFRAVMRWVKAESARQNLAASPENYRKILGKTINLIRFPLMTLEEFATEVVQTGVLTNKECVELFMHFVVNPKPAVKFSSVPRSCAKKEQIVRRFGRTDLRWGYSGTSDRIRFVVDKKIYIVGFGLYGSIHGPSEYECTIMIIHTSTGKEIASNVTGFSCDGSAKTFRVMFKQPVEIYPDTNYTACATLKGPDSHYGSSGHKTVVVELHGGSTVMFKFFYSSGCNNGTSVEDGQIPEIIFYT